MKHFSIRDKQIGQGHEPFIILEAGINHNGDMSIVRKMIDVARESGADALKFQTFKAEEFVSDPKETYTYKSQGSTVTESMLEMFRRYELSPQQWREIAELCRQAGILFFSTPQNTTDLDFLLEIVDMPVIKVGSDDLTNISLLRYYAEKKIPMIISAGMAYLSEVEAAVNAIRGADNEEVAILHCVSSYPAEPSELHLKKLNTLSQAFNVPVGFSDHTIGNTAAIAATALGACILEKHFTINKELPGPDHWFSADEKEVREWVAAIRTTYQALGQKVVAPTVRELEIRNIARRSIVAKKDLRKGSRISVDDIAFKRPGTGLPPSMASYVIGLKLLRDCPKDTCISFNDVRGDTDG